MSIHIFLEEVTKTDDSIHRTPKWKKLQLKNEEIKVAQAGELVEKEKQKNEYRFFFALFSILLAVAWMIITTDLIYKSGLEKSEIDVDYRVLIAMLGATFVTIYTPLHVLSKYLFNGDNE